MPRAHRYITRSIYYHVTHRCHDRSFLLKFARDKEFCRDLLRERLKETRTESLAVGNKAFVNHIEQDLQPCEIVWSEPFHHFHIMNKHLKCMRREL